MTIDYLTRNWALVIASVIGTAVLLFVLLRAFQNSTRGRLGTTVAQLRQREKQAAKAARAVAKATARLERLRAKAESVKPRHAQEASEALADALALQKIAADQVLVARNHLRKLILEEYPPKRQAALRAKFLGPDQPDAKPFTLDR